MVDLQGYQDVSLHRLTKFPKGKRYTCWELEPIPSISLALDLGKTWEAGPNEYQEYGQAAKKCNLNAFIIPKPSARCGLLCEERLAMHAHGVRPMYLCTPLHVGL